MRIPLGTTDYSRSLAGVPDITVKNRYFEDNPENQEDQVALLPRPSLTLWDQRGDGPIRQFYSEPGSFDDAAFMVSGDTIYKYTKAGVASTVGTLGTSGGDVSMAATDVYLFIADGESLHYYTENDYARGTLTASGAVSAAETVVIGSVHYAFASDVSPNTADGSSGNPWLVSLGGSTAEALQHLFDAIGDTGLAGTDYSLALSPNSDAAPISVDDTTLIVRGAEPGTSGNSIATTETMANASWSGSVLSGGGATAFNAITVPDGDGIVSVGVIAGFCICIVAQGQDKNGRFYWIQPGEIIIEPLNFATAERSPDPVWEVKVVGDSFLLPGPTCTEPWYPNGDPLAPFLRQQGRVFDLGVWPGTIVKIDDAFMAVDTSGIVYLVAGPGADPIQVSTPGIEQRIREAILLQRAG